MPRPALLPVEHPLSYSYTKPSGTEPTECLLASPKSLEDKVQYLFEHQQITNLLNDYAYILDVCMVDSSAAHRWVALFTDDCSVTYPFGTHSGIAGLADWCLNAELRFHRMLVSTSPNPKEDHVHREGLPRRLQKARSPNCRRMLTTDFNSTCPQTSP